MERNNIPTTTIAMTYFTSDSNSYGLGTGICCPGNLEILEILDIHETVSLRLIPSTSQPSTVINRVINSWHGCKQGRAGSKRVGTGPITEDKRLGVGLTYDTRAKFTPITSIQLGVEALHTFMTWSPDHEDASILLGSGAEG